VALGGIVPAVYVLTNTRPFVTHIHLHLPAAARTSKSKLEQYIRALPPSARLTVTTMSAISKPRYSDMRVGDLRPVKSRLGVVNYVRDDVSAERASRRWYNLAPAKKFFVQTREERPKPKRFKKVSIDFWIWDAIEDKLRKRQEFGTW
jgi:hypothetical protein